MPTKRAQLEEHLKGLYGEKFEPVMQMAANAHIMQTELQHAIDHFKWLTDSPHEDLVLADIDVRESALVKIRAAARGQIATLAKECNVEWDRVSKYVTPTVKAVDVQMSGGMNNSTRELTEIEAKALNDELTHEYCSS